MKRTFLVFLLLLTCQIKLFSQDKADSPQPTSAPSGKFQIGLSFSPNVSYRWLRLKGGNSSNESNMETMDKYETPVFGFTTGVNGIYSFNQKSGIQFGINVSKSGYQSKWHDEFWIIWGDQFKVHTKSRSEYYYLEVPISYQHFINQGKFRLLMRGGIITHLFLKGTYHLSNFYSPEIYESSNPIMNSRPYLSGLFSAGLDWQLHPRINFRVEPIVRFGLTSINDYAIRTHLWSAGLDCSVFYRF
ncbi:MAG TPA: hypothetical protein PLK63_17460 [Catalimonadaceae bacterium]|nr:hypothetical protein [Catalimonadaceae bacterium]